MSQDNKLHPFEYQKPTPESTNAIITLRIAHARLHECLLWNIPDCRERSIAITKLEECSMWANKAVVFAQKEGEADGV